MRRSLALLLAVLMLCGATITGQTQIQGVFILGEQAVGDSFVTLDESALYGSSGATVFNYAARVQTPSPIGIPPLALWATYTQVTDMQDDVCSTGEDTTTWDALVTRYNAASGPTVLWLPDDCRVLQHLRPSTGGNAYDFAFTKDEVILRCADDATDCGIRQWFENTDVDPGADPEWDYTRGDISRASTQSRGFTIGRGLPVFPTPPIVDTLDWGNGSDAGMAANYARGSYILDIQEPIRTTGLTGTFVGPGDIIHVLINPVSTAAENAFQHMTRVKCVDGEVVGPSDRLGENCSADLGDNKIEMLEPLPMDYADNAYYWGDTVGHRVEILERVGSSRCGIVGSASVCGVSTETNNVTEGFGLYKLKFDRGPLYTGETGAGYFQVTDAYDTQIYRNDFETIVGGSAFTVGGSNFGRAGRTNIFGNIFRDDPWKVICFAEVVSVGATNPATVTLYNSGCGFDDLGNNSRIGFSNEVAEPFLRGKTFLMTGTVNNGGSPSTVTVTIGALDGTATGGHGAGAGGALLTAGGGTAGELDNFAHALFYCINGASNTQFVSNALLGTGMGGIVEAGCTSHIKFANYSLHTPYERTERADFHHSNANAPGGHTEMNDMDVTMTVYASSVTKAGEGLFNTYFKNRGRNTADPGITPWAGSDARARGTIDFTEQSNQEGAANEKFNFFENAWQDIAGSTSRIDCSDNTPPNGGSACTADEPPYMLYELGWHRNRLVASGANADDNFDQFGFDGTPNPTTSTDVTGSNTNGTLYESATVPGAYSDSAAAGHVPTGIFYESEPPWWSCTGGTTAKMVFGEMGASYDDFTGTLTALPIQTILEGGSCSGMP